MTNIQTIGIVGAGTMGNGIAHVAAAAGFKVLICDTDPKALDRAIETVGKNLDREVTRGKRTADEKILTLSRIRPVSELNALSSADFIIEAIIEDAESKLQIFKALDETVAASATLASNTSSISITKIASATRRPEKVIGMHFMNPVPVMKLVEVINGYSTSKEVTNTIVELSKQLGKTPCVVNDYPGFIANRILLPMIKKQFIAYTKA